MVEGALKTFMTKDKGKSKVGMEFEGKGLLMIILRVEREEGDL